MRACHTFELPSFRKVRSQYTKDRFGIIYYHLRYHLWVGVRRDSSGTNSTTTEQNAHRRDPTGLNRCTERLATNQKVAGSSPAERAQENPANRGVLFLALSPQSGFDHLLDHLSLRKALGETSEGVGLDVRHDVRVGVHRLVYSGVAEDLLEDLNRLVGLHPQRGKGMSQGVEPCLFGRAA
jgi:hypothetical protein